MKDEGLTSARLCLKAVPFILHPSSLFLSLCLCAAQPKSGLRPEPRLSPQAAEIEGRQLAADLLVQKPTSSSTNSGVMSFRQPNAQRRQANVVFAVVLTTTNWMNLYRADRGDAGQSVELTIIHSDNQPNQYLLRKGAQAADPNAPALKLTGNQTMVPFAGSDFWIADLGLEFFHWPKQLLIKDEMRRGRACHMLEAINPKPAPGAYSKVDSWIDNETGGIVHAEAYDDSAKLLKEFDPKKFEKINGQWQLEGMEIRNIQTGSRTRIDFNLNVP